MTEQRDFGARPELAWLPIDRLGVSDTYQRSLHLASSQKLISRIAGDFRWSAFQAILATPNGAERWLIIDGQHRVAAARLAGLSLVPAVVIHQASLAEQAAAFVSANKDRVPMSPQSLHKARLLAGDAEAALLQRLCDAADITLLHYPIGVSRLPAGKTAAVPDLQLLLRRHGETVAGNAIRAVADAYREEPSALRGVFFLAAGRFLAEIGGDGELRCGLGATRWQDLQAVAFGLNRVTAIADVAAKLHRAATASLQARVAPLKPVAPPARVEPETPAPLKVGELYGKKPITKAFRDDPRARADLGSQRNGPWGGIA